MAILCPDGSKLQEPNAKFKQGRYARGFSGASPGITELAMGYISDDVIKVTGYVVFGGSDVYLVDATARGADSSFSGTGRFGSSSRCNLTISNRD